MDVVPTGLEIDAFAGGDGPGFRSRLGIPREAFLVGHVGRLAPEKNIDFLSRALVRFVGSHPAAQVLVVGGGPSGSVIEAAFDRSGTRARLHMAGPVEGRELADAYAAMDVFAFASQTETQGMVVTEAMAAGVPIVAVDAPGVREVVVDEHNGRLLPSEDEKSFAAALKSIAGCQAEMRDRFQSEARSTAMAFAIGHCADRALGLYRECIDRGPIPSPEDHTSWRRILRSIAAEWELIKSAAEATEAALGLDEDDRRNAL